MNRRKSVTKWTAGLLVLGILLSLVLMTGSLRPREPQGSLPSGTLPITPEEAASRGGGEAPPEETEPPEETQPPEETEPPETEETRPSGETVPPEETRPEAPSASEPQEGPAGTDPDPKPAGDGEAGDPGGPGGENPGGGEGESPGPGGDGPEDDTRLRIVTDLTDCVITYDQLEEDCLPFYAYLVNAQGDMYLRVKLRNSRTPANGTYLTPTGRDFRAELARQENNFITLYVKQGTTTVLEATYVIFYTARKADADHPTVGDHPPTVVTNLDGFTGEMTNRNFTFLVQARTCEGALIYASNLLVTLDGQPVTNPTGSEWYEYQLYFEDPAVGDSQEHEITVLAWDGAGNSVFLRYLVTYSFVDTGGRVGTAYILLDATTVGLDPDTLGGVYTYEIQQNRPASYGVLAMLEEFGYEAEYDRTPDDGFYLRRISRTGMMDYGEIPENLWQKVLDDEISLTGQSSADSLGQRDFTYGSGWMYSVNGTLYAGKGLSEYYLSDGDTLYIRFTLAYGKDIGGYNASGGSYGRLPTYCGRWINGTYIDEHAWEEARILREPTCTEPGRTAQVCSVCGDTREEVPLEPLGHDLRETGRREPTCTEPGLVTEGCARCGETVETALEPLGHDFQETGRQEPTEEQEGWVDYTCTRCGEKKRETLPPATPPTATPPHPRPVILSQRRRISCRRAAKRGPGARDPSAAPRR